MERKLIKQGIDSYTITLPRGWVKEHELAAGDSVELVSMDAGLTLVPKAQKRKVREITLAAASEPEVRRNMLVQAYRRGFDRITVPLKGDDVREVKSIVRSLMMGFEVIEQDKRSCVIENVAEPSPEKFFPMFRKFIFLIKEGAKAVIEELRTHKLREKERDEQAVLVDLYGNYLQRMIVRGDLFSKADSSMLSFIIWSLSFAYRRYYYLVQRLQRHEGSISAQILDELEKTIDLVDVVFDCIFKKDTAAAFDLSAKKVAHFDRFYASVAGKRGVDSFGLYHLAEIVRLLQIAGSTALGCEFVAEVN